MFKNQLFISWRILVRNRLLSVVHIGGLALGIACSALLLSYVAFERSFDRSGPQAKDIYRVNLDMYREGRLVMATAENYPGAGPALKQEFPEVEQMGRLYNLGYKNNCVFSSGEMTFKETKFMYADAAILTMFGVPFLAGDASSALSQPGSAVISESTARRLFGPKGVELALGRPIKMTDDDRHTELCKITGVLKDNPGNSHVQFNILISYSTLYHDQAARNWFGAGWVRKDFYTYVQLRPGTDPAALTTRLAALVRVHRPGEKAKGEESRMILEPLTGIHLTAGWQDEPEPVVGAKGVGLLLIIAFFILTIAWVNYINLATAGAGNRAREIGIRKVLGSDRGQLIRQFLTESILLNGVAFVLAMGLVRIARPGLEGLLGLSLPVGGLLTSQYGIVFWGFLAAGAFLSGLYPALVLSGFQPVMVLKGQLPAGRRGWNLRRVLVVFQFTLSIGLIIGTLVVYGQVHYMLSQDLGVRTAQVMTLDRPGRWDTARATHSGLVRRFREAVRNTPSLEGVGMADECPGKEIRWPTNYQPAGQTSVAAVPINTTLIDADYLPVLGLHLVAGRNFSGQLATDVKSLILSASAVAALGYHNPVAAIGQRVHSDDGDYAIVGVVGDFHQLSLEQQNAPAAFQLNGGDWREFEYYFVRLRPGRTAEGIAALKAAWTSAFPDNPFVFSFLDESFNRQYQSEIRFGIFFVLFSVLTIVVACVGLFALVAFMVRQRTREIGVRKVLGASVWGLFWLVCSDFLRLIGLANLVAWPLAGWWMMGWLQGFAYRIPLHWWVFGAAGGFALLLALATISWQAVRAARSSPAEALRV